MRHNVAAASAAHASTSSVTPYVMSSSSTSTVATMTCLHTSMVLSCTSPGNESRVAINTPADSLPDADPSDRY